MTLPAECDYCDQVLDDDESLVGVYVGDPPTPRAVVAEATAPKCRRSVGYGTGEDVEVLGKPADEVQALLTAIDAAEGFTLETYGAVDRVTAGFAVDGEPVHRTTRDDTVAAATLRVEPDGHDRAPDLRVCEFCADALRNP